MRILFGLILVQNKVNAIFCITGRCIYIVGLSCSNASLGYVSFSCYVSFVSLCDKYYVCVIIHAKPSKVKQGKQK